MNKKILLIGGNGFIGNRLIEYFRKEEIEVWCRNIKRDSSNVKYRKVDISKDIKHIDSKNKYKIIVNLTGQISNPIKNCLLQNTNGIKNIISLHKQNEDAKIIQLSTVAVYGECNHCINEQTPTKPDTPYGKIKLVAEKELINSVSSNKLYILRLSNIYGKDQNKGLIPYLLKCLKNNTIIEFDNNGLLKRNYIHIDDACSEIISIIFSDLNGITNIYGNTTITILDILNFLKNQKTIKFILSNKNGKSNINCVESLRIESNHKTKQTKLLEFLKSQLI